MVDTSALKFVYYKNQVYVDYKVSRSSKFKFLRK